MAEARIANFASLPFDVHVYIVKLLKLNEALIYEQLAPEANAAVQYVFAHRKQLDFGSVLGPNGQIMLSGSTFIQVLHAHVRVETITDFSLQPSFTALREYMETHWILMDSDCEYPERKTHGYLCNIRYPTHTILVLPHLNKAESCTIKYGRVLLMNMGSLLLIIPTGIPFSLLIMHQGTGQHRNQQNQTPCQKLPGPLLQQVPLISIRTIRYSLVITRCPTLLCSCLITHAHTRTLMHTRTHTTTTTTTIRDQ